MVLEEESLHTAGLGLCLWVDQLAALPSKAAHS